MHGIATHYSLCYDIMNSVLLLYQGINDPQTEADRRAQRCIFATLKQRFPQLAIIGEEVYINYYVQYSTFFQGLYILLISVIYYS